MSGILSLARANLAYAFIAVGAIWLLVAYSEGPLVIWPVATLIVAGVLLKVRPGERFTWSWAISAAVLGFFLSAYQAYSAYPLLTGTFSSIAEISMAGFGLFSLVHLFLLYLGVRAPGQATK